MISQKTMAAIAVGILIAFGAHASGKPWWVDYPFMGDAADVGILSAGAVRFMLSLFDRDDGK